MIKYLLFFFAIMIMAQPDVQLEHTVYFPMVANKNGCSDKSGVALGAISESAFNELCLSNWYEYNLIPYDRFNGSDRYYVYWCDEYIDPDGRIYIMRQQMLDNHDFDFSGYVIFFNEWGYTNQCGATEDQYISEFQWLKEHYPYAKLIVGNTYGHDHLYGYARLRLIHDLIVGAGYNWNTDIYGVGIHDYTLTDPAVAIEALRELQSSWGSNHPVYVTEFVTHNLDEYLSYYEAQPEVKAWFWFLPCNMNDEYDLLTNDCTDTLTNLGLQMRGLNTR